jgi:hypothetical protein
MISYELVLKCHAMLNYLKHGRVFKIFSFIFLYFIFLFRYSTLLASIESLSLLLKIAQIPACRALINRLIFSIEQRSQQLNKLSQLASATLSNSQQLRRDLNDEDFLSFRSALSSYEHLFTVSS